MLGSFRWLTLTAQATPRGLQYRIQVPLPVDSSDLHGHATSTEALVAGLSCVNMVIAETSINPLLPSGQRCALLRCSVVIRMLSRHSFFLISLYHLHSNIPVLGDFDIHMDSTSLLNLSFSWASSISNKMSLAPPSPTATPSTLPTIYDPLETYGSLTSHPSPSITHWTFRTTTCFPFQDFFKCKIQNI